MLDGGTPAHSAGKNAEADEALQRAIADVIAQCDADRLARRLGLRSAEAAKALRRNPASLSHLASRLAEACAGLTPDEAATLCASLFQQPDVSSNHQPNAQVHDG